MRQPTITLVYDRRHVATATRLGTVEISVTHKSKRIFIGTGVRVPKPQWNARGSFVHRRADGDVLNEMISERLADVRRKVSELWTAGRFTLDALKESMKQGKVTITPLEWMRQRIEQRPISESTRKQHETAWKLWRDCGLFNSWESITLATIEAYDRIVRQRVGRSTVYNYHKRLKIYLGEAVRHGLLKSSPYDIFKVKRVDDVTTIKYLTAEEVEMLKAAKVGEVLDRVRDLWLFSYYTGLSYAELSTVGSSLVHEEGRTYIETKRKKTGVPVRLLLISEAAAILKKYGGTLPVITNQKYNYFLKILATAAGIEKNLTSHMARHSFATFALKAGVPKDVIAVMLGHSGMREVDRYARRLQEDVDAEFLRLENVHK